MYHDIGEYISSDRRVLDMVMLLLITLHPSSLKTILI